MTIVGLYEKRRGGLPLQNQAVIHTLEEKREESHIVILIDAETI